MKTIQAYRFALDLTAGQERGVLAHAGAARVAHNWALARVKAVMGRRAAERGYGVADERLTPSLSWSLAGLRKAWNAAKPEVAPWWAEVSKEAFTTGAIFHQDSTSRERECSPAGGYLPTRSLPDGSLPELIR